MTDTIETKTPMHLWIVGVLSLLWNAGGGGQNYLAVKSATPEYYAQQGEAIGVSGDVVRAYMESYPLWANIAFGIGVWCAVLGSILLLFRSRFAAPAFALSLAGFLAGVIYQTINPIPGMDSMTLYWVMNTVIGLSIALFWYYARRMTVAGVLR